MSMASAAFGRSHANDFTARVPQETRVWQIFRLALLIRVIVAIALHFAVAEAMFAPDQETYRRRAQALAASWAADSGPPFAVYLPEGPVAYYYVVAVVFYLFGTLPLLPKLLNCLVGALSVPLVHDLTLRLGGSPGAAMRAARFVAWFPSLVLWSALNIRDAWIVLLILLIARQALVLQDRFRLGTLVLLGAAMLALIQFRSYVLLPVAAPVVVALLVQRSRNPLRNLILGSIAAVMVIYADQAAGSDRKVRLLDLEEIQQRRDWNIHGAASGFEQVDISTPGKAIAFLPKGLAYFLLAPIPWMIGSIRQVLAVPETLFFYSLLPNLFRGVRYLLQHQFRKSLMVVLITASLTFGYALGEGNAGTAYRHRAQILCFFLVFAAIGLESKRKPPQRPRTM
jgi:hypothetical protein